jgi:hypothetical protein
MIGLTFDVRSHQDTGTGGEDEAQVPKAKRLDQRDKRLRGLVRRRVCDRMLR